MDVGALALTSCAAGIPELLFSAAAGALALARGPLRLRGSEVGAALSLARRRALLSAQRKLFKNAVRALPRRRAQSCGGETEAAQSSALSESCRRRS